MFTPSAHQLAIAAHVLGRLGNLIIRATAGSGKTTTIVWLFKQLTGRVLFLAFGKKIQLELESRGVPARTFNSLGFEALRNAYRVGKVNGRKIFFHLSDTLSERESAMYPSFCAKLVGLAKNEGVGAMVADTEEVWYDLIDKHDLELKHREARLDRAVEIAREALEWSSNPAVVARVIDYDDQVYLPIRFKLKFPTFDNVLVDETQDLNAIQRAVLKLVLGDNGLLTAVGDDAQAIFGFRGADSDAMLNVERDFNCVSLPLTVSYRCASKIVEYAKEYGEIEAAPNAIEGDVRTGLTRDAILEAQPGDIFVSRTTRPLIEVAYSFLKQHKAAYVLGSEIGQGLISLIEKMNAKGVDQLQAKLNEFTAREVQKHLDNKNESKAEAVQDKTDCVLFLIDTLKETDRTVPALIRLIEELFADKANAVMLSSIHRAKGLEARRVYWLDYMWTNKWARQEWQHKQERNLRFVAATRAKEELVLLPGSNEMREAA